MKIYNSQLEFVSTYTLNKPSPNCYINTSPNFISLSSPVQIIHRIKDPTRKGLDLKKESEIELKSTPLNRATSGPGCFDPIKR